jgi:hypothetical protein
VAILPRKVLVDQQHPHGFGFQLPLTIMAEGQRLPTIRPQFAPR